MTPVGVGGLCLCGCRFPTIHSYPRKSNLVSIFFFIYWPIEGPSQYISHRLFRQGDLLLRLLSDLTVAQWDLLISLLPVAKVCKTREKLEIFIGLPKSRQFEAKVSNFFNYHRAAFLKIILYKRKGNIFLNKAIFSFFLSINNKYEVLFWFIYHKIHDIFPTKSFRPKRDSPQSYIH